MRISKLRKRPALRTKIARRITEISRSQWESVFPKVPESYDFFRTLDGSGFGQFSFYYIMVYKDKEPVGATTCFTMNYSLDTSVSGPLKRLTVSIKKLAPRIFNIKVLVCGTPIAPGRIGFKGDGDPVVRAILRRMERMAKREKAHIIAFKDFDKSYMKTLAPLKKEGFTRLNGLPLTELKIDFKDFEGYLATLHGENRYGLRRKYRKVDKNVTITMEEADALEDGALRDAYSLFCNVETKHGVNFEKVPVDFFRNIPKNMPGETKFFLWRINGAIVMFLFCLVSDGVLIDYYVGFDYKIAYKYHLYFIQFRDMIKWCIDNNISKFEMGVTGYETKRRLGFDFIHQDLYVRLRNRMLRPAFNLICKFLKFENYDPALRRLK